MRQSRKKGPSRDKELQEAEDRGFHKALEIISIKLLDGGVVKSPNEIRAEAVKRARELWEEMKKMC